jgi:hypothetical protein
MHVFEMKTTIGKVLCNLEKAYMRVRTQEHEEKKVMRIVRMGLAKATGAGKELKRLKTVRKSNILSEKLEQGHWQTLA